MTADSSAGSGPASSRSVAVPPQDTVFDFTGSPQLLDSADVQPVGLGVKLKADSGGLVSGIRFHESAANTGTTVTFSSPVAIAAGTTYVAGYFAPNGHYSVTLNGLATSVDNPPLHAVANATSVNGIFAYSGSSTLPINGHNASNYWVDVLYFVARRRPPRRGK